MTAKTAATPPPRDDASEQEPGDREESTGQQAGLRAATGGERPAADHLSRRPWHAVGRQDTIDALVTDPGDGLKQAEAEDRRARYGRNKLPAGTISLAIGNVEDAGFNLAVLLFNAGLGTYQEYRAESAAQALQQVMKIKAVVRRGGRQKTIHGEEWFGATSSA